MKLDRISRYYYLRFTRLKGDPHSLAMGTAIGVIVGISPTMPLHTVLLLIITFVTRTSTLAAIISSWVVCNPLTYIPIYYFSMVVGNLITPYELSWLRVRNLIDTLMSHPSFSQSLKEVASLGYEAMIVMVLGGFVLALPFTVVSYYLSLHLFINIREKRKRRRRKMAS